MAVKQVAIRLKPEGGAETVAVFRSAEEAGVRAATNTAAAADKATAAAARQEAQWRRNAEAMQRAANAADAQARFNAALGVDRPGSSASASADVFAAAFRAEEDAARKAAALRAQLDPAGAALDRLNGELREYELLARRGAISSTELAKAQQLARTRYDETTAALARNTGGLTRNQMASRLNLARQGADVLVTAGMGMNPGMIALQQGPQILDALSTSGLKARGAMVLLGGALGLTAAAGAGAVMAWRDAEKGALALERAATGLGRTSGVTAAELETLAIAGAEQGEISVRSARDQAAAWASTGRISGEIIGGLLAMSKDYAAFMGQEAPEAAESLARAMLEPDKAARELTRQIGLLDQRTLDHIDSLVEHGDKLAAQKILLEALTGAVEGQADKIGEIETAWDAAARAVSNYWDKLGRALYTTPDERVTNAERAVEIALRSRAGGKPVRQEEIDRLIATRDRLRTEQSARLAAEATAAERAAANQAAQDARDRQDRRRTRSGGRAGRSAEREARRQLQFDRQEEDRAAELDLEWARATRDSDRVRALEDEAKLRQRIRQLVDDGKTAEQARTTALAEQARLLGARAVEQGRELDRVNRAAAFEVDRELGLQRTVQLEDNRLELLGRINDYVEAGSTYYAAWLAAARDQLEVEQAREAVMARQVAIAEREHQLTLARLSGRALEVERLDRAARIEARAREIERREKLDYGEGEARARDEIAAEISAEAEGVRRRWMKDFVSDIRRGDIREALASQFESAADRLIGRLIDSLFDVDWGAALGGGKGKGGGGGWLGSLIGSAADLLFGGTVGRNAAGTEHWRGGWSWLGEEGPELAWLPPGSKVASHPQSMRMMAQAARPSQVVDARQYHFTGNLLTPEFMAEIERRDRMAARAGAQQGAQAAVGFVQGTAAEAQHVDRMTKA